MRKFLLVLFVPECVVYQSEYASKKPLSQPTQAELVQYIGNEGNNPVAENSTPARDPHAFISVLTLKFTFLNLIFIMVSRIDYQNQIFIGMCWHCHFHAPTSILTFL